MNPEPGVPYRATVTATWNIDADVPITPDIAGGVADAVTTDPVAWIGTLNAAERWPSGVDVRPARPDSQPDLPELFSGPALVREALRRLAEADAGERVSRQQTGEHVAPDGVAVTWRCAYGYAEHQRQTAAVLAELAGVAARVAPGYDDRLADEDEEWAAALSLVHVLTPVPAEEQDDPDDPEPAAFGTDRPDDRTAAAFRVASQGDPR